jgi:hypothetical protein
MIMKLGMQIVSTRLIDRWPIATILSGEIGEIVDITSDGVHVELRKIHAGLAPFGEQVLRFCVARAREPSNCWMVLGRFFMMACGSSIQ